LEMILLLRATVTNKSSQMISIEEIYKPWIKKTGN
jgi:hypothetical protein